MILRKTQLTSHSKMSGSRWVITWSWLSASWRSFLYSSSVYSCHLFLISSASVRSVAFLPFIGPIFAWSVPLVSLIFLKRSLVFAILLFSSISLQDSLLYLSRNTGKTALKLWQIFAGYGLMVKLNRRKNKNLNKMFPTKEQRGEAQTSPQQRTAEELNFFRIVKWKLFSRFKDNRTSSDILRSQETDLLCHTFLKIKLLCGSDVLFRDACRNVVLKKEKVIV